MPSMMRPPQPGAKDYGRADRAGLSASSSKGGQITTRLDLKSAMRRLHAERRYAFEHAAQVPIPIIIRPAAEGISLM